MDLIDRQEAIDSMCELMRHWFGCDPKDEIREIKRELGKLPTIEPEQPQRMRGRWKRAYLDHEAMGERPSIFYCSACNQYIAFPTNYCPACGADMREGQDG